MLDELGVLALPAETGQDVLLDLDRLGGARCGVAGDLRPFQRPTGGDRLIEAANVVGAGPLEPARVDEPLHLLVVVQAGVPASPDAHHHLLAGGERLGLAHHVGDRHDPRLGAERPGAVPLDLPQRPEP